ncbi:hypothetical protein BD769DRAFT_1597406 [Suillus cothurnatus]|nr:hypothetical protein BD769DRAFT_1597406 [Suillus cothurnatus]
MFGFSVLIIPLNHAKHLISRERLSSTLVYLSRLGLTIHFSISVSLQSFITARLRFYQAHSYLGSLLVDVVQVLSLIAYALA